MVKTTYRIPATPRNEARAMHNGIVHFFKQLRPWRRREVLRQLERINVTLPRRKRERTKAGR